MILKDKKMKIKNFIYSFFGSLTAMVITLILFLQFSKQEYKKNEIPVPISTVNETVIPKIEFNFDFTYAAKTSISTVVHIKTTVNKDKYLKRNPLLDYFLGDSNFEVPILGSGSGVIISKDGYIVTNNHVIANFDKIEVVLNDKRKYKAKIIGRDEGTDLALLKINAQNLVPIKFANSDSVKIGQWVLAVGNPYNLTSTVTAGIVSAKAREINLLKDKEAVESFIQTDAAVNPGNSGGALVNPKGEMVGINSAIASKTGSYAGYSFAIPSNIVKKVINDLMKYGFVQRAILGAQIIDISDELIGRYQLKRLDGVFVEKVEDGSAAYQAGIKAKDLIIQIGKTKINKVSEFKEQLSLYHPGDKIEFSVLRNNKIEKFNVLLKNVDGTNFMKNKGKIEVIGAILTKKTIIDPKTNKPVVGLEVNKLFEGKFKSAGITQGVIITKFNNAPVSSLRNFQEKIEHYKGGVYLEGYLTTGEKVYFAFGLN